MSFLDSWLEKLALHSKIMDQPMVLSSDSFRQFYSLVINNPLTWWIVILLVLYIMEVFQLGPHSLPWNWRKSGKNCPPQAQYCNGSSGGLKFPLGNGIGHDECDGSVQGAVPAAFHKFVRTKIVPTFSQQREKADDKFAVLVFSNVNSLTNSKRIRFKQITFGNKPLVNPSLPTYPESYRYENYVVARSDEAAHPEELITKQVSKLLDGFRQAERSFIRNPIPLFGILYCPMIPCSQCTEKIIKSLGTVCRKRMVFAYSEESNDAKDSKTNIQHMISAGISVIKVDDQ